MTRASDCIAATPAPPYYAVVFTSQRGDPDPDYDTMAMRMVELAASQPGYLGVESVRDASGLGITVSYWASESAIADWRHQVDHVAARARGRRDWYQAYRVRVARVERDHGGPPPAEGTQP